MWKRRDSAFHDARVRRELDIELDVGEAPQRRRSALLRSLRPASMGSTLQLTCSMENAHPCS